MAQPKALRGVLLFHLNLSYSAIPEADQPEVVRRCYRPLLGLLEEVPGLRLAIEASGHTLERIAAIDPEWVQELRRRCHEGRIEFVGSGDSQLIGPLVPERVNLWNQRLGQATYENLLGISPSVALVNEMAWSQGIVGAYREAGYRAVVMEWNNPRRIHPEWEEEWRYRHARTASPSGDMLEVLWADAVAFQKLQRTVAGDLDLEEYVEWVKSQAGSSAGNARALFLYANDAEIFDYRPGRYRSEPDLDVASGEWGILARILQALRMAGVTFALPSEILEDPELAADVELVLNGAGDPIPVKKQPKYNASRWALTGHNDLGLNAACFERERALVREGGSEEDWRELCRSWSSDLRTHLTEERWSRCVESAAPPSFLSECEEPESEDEPHPDLTVTEVHHGPRRLTVTTDGVELVLLPRRGLAIESLRFPGVRDRPLLGTLPHGFFEDIDWAADFYTGHTVLDLPARERITDLEKTQPRIRVLADRIEVLGEIDTPLGSIPKRITVFADRVELSYGFSKLGERPTGVLRTGFLTLHPDGLGERLFVCCENGGPRERFEIQGDFDHGASVSPLVSSRALFGATSGRLDLEDGETSIEVRWPNWKSAALPLLTARRVRDTRFLRLAFSLAEVDETCRPGAPLYDFQFALSARRLSA